MPERLSNYRSLLNAIETRRHSVRSPMIVAIAGPPATGKSTLAERLVEDLRAAGQSAVCCPMDGFHKTNKQLDAAGLRNVKGHIDTFNAGEFVAAVARLVTGEAFWWPSYSRHRHDPVPEGTRIEGRESVCVIEGNYILTDAEPWRSAAIHFDLRIFVDAPDTVLCERLMQRHRQGGMNDTETGDKIARTDMPNAVAIRKSTAGADILFRETVNG